MKCPNCSFQNSDDAIACKVCGYELPRPIKTPKENPENAPPSEQKASTKKRILEDEDDKALDDVMKSLFGHDHNARVEDEDDALDAAMMERLLKKKRVQQQQQSTVKPVPTQVEKTPPTSESKTQSEKPQYNVRIIFSAAVIVLVLFFLLKTGFSKSFWRYDSDAPTTETTTVGTSETTREVTTEIPFSLGDEAILEPINLFFRNLPDFVNKGNLNILTLFTSSQDALEVLTDFAAVGNLEKITSTTIDAIDLLDDGGAYKITTVLNRLISGQQTETSAIWDFKVIKTSSGYAIDSLGIESGDLIIPVETTTVKPTQATTTTQASTEATTERAAVVLEGFIEIGGFTGGVLSSSQDIGSARFGHNIEFDRIVFDLYNWNGNQPTETVEVVTQYATSISENQKVIKVTFTGVMDAYAKNLALDLKGHKSVESVTYDVSKSNETVVVTITLSEPSSYKVLNVKSPARLIVDFAPLN